MRTTESRRLILASLAATALLAFALGVATALWFVSPYVRPTASPLPGAVEQTLPVAAAPAIAEWPRAVMLRGTESPGAGATDAGRNDTAFLAAPNQATSPVVQSQPSALPADSAEGPPAGSGQAAASPAVAPAKTPTVPSPLALRRGQAYQVHLGAFHDAQAAERVRSMVSDQGFEIAIIERPIGNGETWLLAVSADFADRTDALRLAARLHREIGIDPLVVRAPTIAGDAG